MRCLTKYLLWLMLVLPQTGRAQAGRIGLVPFVLGSTTPDSLDATDFSEQDQPLVKGTLALVCAHVRTFTASQVMVEGIPVTKLVLHFYDNRLFRLDCDYDEPLGGAFTRTFGPGMIKPESQFRVCTQENDKLMTVWGVAWPGEETEALVVYQKGYTAACQPEEGARLILWSQSVSALCSECDLQPANPLLEAYRQLQQQK